MDGVDDFLAAVERVLHRYDADRHTETMRALEKLTHRFTTIDRKLDAIMTQASDNQAHLDQGVAAIGASIATAVQELKDQIAGGTAAAALDFTALDNLAASTAAEASADAPPATP